ncbi:PST family polysaccharide transporter [Lactobacillus selangorensis]|uniref:PST family polysaccharide transporter n=1 Tax=Lactobacillus selangorensis TaxID=81857 RepID=A0A0R2FTW4_9LACO|nr:flippase [Lactobacillus selangorensis]KRN28358.1 PST family polysaccharide transporter [Lactobacillus selangorensis]KRN31859.1 PST family polysaccharide transporter [Lactobacillus selangorensis]
MKVIKNYLWNVMYQLLVIVIPLITVHYVTRVLGATGYGINSFTNANTQYFVLFGSIGVSLYGNRQIAYHRDDRKKTSQTFWEIYIMRACTLGLAMIAFYIFMLFTGQYKADYFMQSFLIWAAAFDISWFFMGFENFQVTVVRNMLVKILSLVLIFMFVKTRGDLPTYILILSLSQLAGNLTLWPYLRHYVDMPDWHHLNIWQHLRPSLVLFVPQIATSLYLSLNKTMLGSMVSVASAGFYDNSDKIIKMVLAVVTATGTVMLPHVANAFAHGDKKSVHRYLYMSFDFVSFLSVPLMFGIAAIATAFAPWFFTKSFAEVGKLMMIESIVMLMIAWSNVLGVQYLLPTNRNKPYTFSVTLGAIVNVVLNVPLIMIWKTNGAMWSTVLSEVAVTGYQLWVVRHDIDIPRLFTNLWKYLVAGAVMFVVVYWMNLHFTMGYVMLVVEATVGAVIYAVLILILKPTVLQTAKMFLDRRRNK